MRGLLCYVVKEALLVRQCKERRIAFSEGSAYKPPVNAACRHVGDICSAPALPLSKYCLQRILPGFCFQNVTVSQQFYLYRIS